MATYIEKELHFTFPDELEWNEHDAEGLKLPQGMKCVDVVIELEDEYIFVEIKDPSDSQTPGLAQRKYLTKLRTNEILFQELTPKARCSYTRLHLMELDNKPIRYVVVLGLDAFDSDLQKSLLGNFADRLFGSLYNEMDVPWKRSFISECVVLSVDGWNERYSDWPIERIKKKDD